MRQVEIARSLMKTPWLHQGRDPAIGIDCIGLGILAFGVPVDQVPADYSRDPHNDMLAAQLNKWFGAPVDDEPHVGDVVELAWGRRGRHIGIVGDDVYGGLSLIHTDSIVGCVTEHPFDDKWLRRLKRVYRR